jgi:hypothetical protein
MSSLNLPTSVVITGIPDLKTLDQAIEAVRTFKPLSQSDLSALLARPRRRPLRQVREIQDLRAV